MKSGAGFSPPAFGHSSACLSCPRPNRATNDPDGFRFRARALPEAMSGGKQSRDAILERLRSAAIERLDLGRDAGDQHFQPRSEAERIERRPEAVGPPINVIDKFMVYSCRRFGSDCVEAGRVTR
jgi:hypothetical protein